MLSHPSESRRGRWSCGALALCLLLGGCSRYDPVQDPVAQTSELIGYKVRVTTTEGRILHFVLRDVTESQLVGDFHRVRLDKVAQVERWHFDIKKTALLLAATAGVYCALAWLLYSRPWLP
jgi:hypothetical protein